MTVLYRRDLGEASLSEAIEALPGNAPEALALVYSARRCCFARLDGTALIDSDGKEVGDDAFEARIFSDMFELRWLQSGFQRALRHGRGVLLHEEPAWGGESLPAIRGGLPRQYLLWGRGDPPADGAPPQWSSLSTARIGTLSVPLGGVPHRARVILRAREYIAEEPEHGNNYVVEERLLGLSIYSGEVPNA
jgi:CRISPR-associated protein (TIGR03984 family)